MALADAPDCPAIISSNMQDMFRYNARRMYQCRNLGLRDG